MALERKKWHLTDYIQEYQESRGVTKLVIMSKIKDYLRRLDVVEQQIEINQLNEEDNINMLLGCGLRQPVWGFLVKRKAELMGL